jgi:hypothetical protein
MIEALLSCGAGIGGVAGLSLRTSPRWLRVCDIKRPRTGLEVKFSYAWLAGMALRGDRTGDERVYADALAADETLAAFAARVEVVGDPAVGDMQAAGTLKLADGRRLALAHDLDAQVPEPVLAGKLRDKARAMLGDRGTALWAGFADPSGRSAAEMGAALRG